MVTRVEEDEDQGWSLRLPRDIEQLVRKVAEKEQRAMKVVVERAIRQYAGRMK